MARDSWQSFGSWQQPAKALADRRLVGQLKATRVVVVAVAMVAQR